MQPTATASTANAPMTLHCYPQPVASADTAELLEAMKKMLQEDAYARNSYPHLMTVQHVKQALGIEQMSAYALMHQEGAPIVQMGRKVFVNRDRFWAWFDSLDRIAERKKGGRIL